jgi:hypothetical protein
MNFIDWATFIAFIAFNVDLLFEIQKVMKTRDSKDVSLPGIFIRLSASTVLVLKFVYIKDDALIIGQGIFTAILLVYFVLLMKFKKKKKK